ncbi:MAG: Uma2 family endonuclease [Cyanobacteria bacterium J06623_5]
MPELLTKTLSFAEYLLLPYDGKKTELVDGQIIEMTEPSSLHINIIRTVTKLIDRHIFAKDYSLECVSGPGVEIPRSGRRSDARDPDIIVCQREQWRAMSELTKSIFLEGNQPDLVIEVSSPGNEASDTVDKRIEYALAKIPEYWIINPIRSYVLVLQLDAAAGTYKEIGEYRNSDRIESGLLPKLQVTASELLTPF